MISDATSNPNTHDTPYCDGANADRCLRWSFSPGRQCMAPPSDKWHGSGMTWHDVTRYTMIWCNMMSLRFNFQWSLSLDNLILSIILDFWIRSEIHCDEIPNMMKILVSFLAGSNFLESCFFLPKCIGTGYPPKSCQLGSGCWHSAWNKALRPAGSACNLEDCLQI